MIYIFVGKMNRNQQQQLIVYQDNGLLNCVHDVL